MFGKEKTQKLKSSYLGYFTEKNHEIGNVNSNMAFLQFYVKNKTVFFLFHAKKRYSETLTKNSMNKSIGSSMLTWNEFEEVLLDIELTLNNRPLIYIDDDKQLPVLAPNTLIHGMNIVNLEEGSDNIDEYELRKKIKVCTKV